MMAAGIELDQVWTLPALHGLRRTRARKGAHVGGGDSSGTTEEPRRGVNPGGQLA